MKLKGLGAGLLSFWLSGFLLIALSFYGTQLLSPSSLNVPFRYTSDSIAAPRITIFTALYGFSLEGNSQALLALCSWLALSSRITVVLFTQHNPSSSFTDKFGSRLLLDSTIDFTFLGTPFLHSMLARIEAYKSDIAVLMDPETVLLPDFISALNYAHELDRDWLLVSSSVSIPRFPFQDFTLKPTTFNGRRINYVQHKQLKEEDTSNQMSDHLVATSTANQYTYVTSHEYVT